MRRRSVLLAGLGGAGCLARLSHAQPSRQSAFENFFAAPSPAEAARGAEALLATGVGFEEALRRLKAGRRYEPRPPGVIMMTNRTEDGVEHKYAVNIPPGYDPSRRYPVRIQLHGGIDSRTDNQPRNNGEIGALAGAEQIYVIPYAWETAPWWSQDQLLNLHAILDSLKRVYNVDENRVVLSGVSDGGTGTYFFAMRETTAFASFLPLNGFIMVLSVHPSEEGRLFPQNLRNKPLFVVNGGKDPLYPASYVEPFLRHLKEGGVEIEYLPQPEAAHNTAWWPQVRDRFEKFVADHPRDPHPAKLTWEAAEDTGKRAHWLVIDRIAGEGAADNADTSMPDVNRMRGLNSEGLMFLRPIPTGRVDVSAVGNHIEASTRGVLRFRLLLSPDRFDLNRPITVTVNGKQMLNRRIAPDVRTLLNHAARDNDRTMLYAAEVLIEVADPRSEHAGQKPI